MINAVVESIIVIVVSKGNAEVLIVSFAFVDVARKVCATAEFEIVVDKGEVGMWIGGDRD